MLEWCVVRCASKNRQPKRSVQKRSDYVLKVLLITLNSVGNIFG